MGVFENRGTSFWCPYNTDPTILGSIFGSPIFGSHMRESYPPSFACCALSGPYKPKAQSPMGPRFGGILFYKYNTKNPKEGHSLVSRLTQKLGS